MINTIYNKISNQNSTKIKKEREKEKIILVPHCIFFYKAANIEKVCEKYNL